MSVRMLTKDLLSLLQDHVLTASEEAGLGGTPGILLHTDRVEEGDEPGGINCLVATSTNRFVIGHSWVEAGLGDLVPTLLPINYVRALIESLKKLLTKDNRNDHVTNLCRDGGEVVIAEDPDLFDGGFTQRFAYADLDTFPRGLFQLLNEVRVTPGEGMPAVEPRTDYTAKILQPFLTIANRHNSPLSMYRAHQSWNVHVQIGTSYRGLIVPDKSWVGFASADGQAPEIGVYAADLPPLPDPEPVAVLKPETAEATS